MSILTSISPSDLDFPSKFGSYRRAQSDLIDFCLYGPSGSSSSSSSSLVPNLDSPRRFICAGAPTGIGKSLAAHTIGRLSGMKFSVLTATKALEDQQCEDFVDGQQIVNIRGRANYPCNAMNGLAAVEWNCEEGSDDEDCSRSGKPGCTYFDRTQEARRARGIVSNYAYWIAARMANPRALELPHEKIGLLICDEAHLAAGALSRALTTWVSNDYLHKWSGGPIRELVKSAKGEEWGRVTDQWIDALEIVLLGANSRLGDIELSHGRERAVKDDEYRRLSKLSSGLERVVSHGRDKNWIWRQTRNGISFDCVWPGKYAERYLWSGVQRVVLLSATLVTKTMNILRIPATEYWFREWPRQFPAANSPVWWVPTSRMGHKAKQFALDECVRVGNDIFREWKQYKGLVHSASYQRAEWLQSKCDWGRYMYINDRGEATKSLDRFIAADTPAALVSPSYSTGTDLPDDLCRWIWIPKLPFPDRSDPIMQARIQDDPDYYSYETGQTLVQACGRHVRSERDWGVTMITDDHIGNFRGYARKYMPRWFKVDKWDKGGVPGAPQYNI